MASFKYRSQIALGIIADRRLMNTLVNASRQTWIPSISYDLFYFVGSQRNRQSPHFQTEFNVIELPSDDDEYPPVNKTFDMWSYFYSQHLSHYNYFMVIDADTYVNVENLQIMLNQLQSNDCYVGRPATGELYERKRLGLQAPYCLGMGYVIANNTLRQFGPHIDDCRRSTVSAHSDTEVGRCIYEFASGISCTSASMPLERVMYTTNKQGHIIPFKLNSRKQLHVQFPETPPTRFFRAALVHPLKTPDSFYRFHQQVKLQLRPVLQPAFLRGSCVANPIIQNEIYPQKHFVPECRLQISEQSIHNLSSLSAFVITLPKDSNRLQQTIDNFKEHNIYLQSFYGTSNVHPPNTTHMTRGEWNLRLTMIRLIEMVINANLEQVLIVEDDAIPHRHFRQRLQTLLDYQRCKECVSGGVLMLGSTTWSAGWKIIDRYKNLEKGLCHNICSKTYGSFAVLLHQATFQPILDWLKSETILQPYDFVFAHLARLGYPVRLASPNLVISDIRHVSLIRPRPDKSDFYNLKHRAKIHRWKLENYMIPSLNVHSNKIHKLILSKNNDTQRPV